MPSSCQNASMHSARIQGIKVQPTIKVPTHKKAKKHQSRKEKSRSAMEAVMVWPYIDLRDYHPGQSEARFVVRSSSRNRKTDHKHSDIA